MTKKFGCPSSSLKYGQSRSSLKPGGQLAPRGHRSVQRYFGKREGLGPRREDKEWRKTSKMWKKNKNIIGSSSKTEKGTKFTKYLVCMWF